MVPSHEEQFFTYIRNPATTESYLRRSLEIIFDIARHILAKTYGFKEKDGQLICVHLVLEISPSR